MRGHGGWFRPLADRIFRERAARLPEGVRDAQDCYRVEGVLLTPHLWSAIGGPKKRFEAQSTWILQRYFHWRLSICFAPLSVKKEPALFYALAAGSSVALPVV